MVHALAMHAQLARFPPHRFPHAPQWRMLVVLSTHWPPQHPFAPPHFAPHWLQWLASLFTSVHRPAQHFIDTGAPPSGGAPAAQSLSDLHPIWHFHSSPTFLQKAPLGQLSLTGWQATHRPLARSQRG